MALIKCPECGKEISDKAKSCPKCGYPINSDEQLYDDELDEDNDDEKDNLPTISSVIAVIFGIVAIILKSKFSFYIFVIVFIYDAFVNREFKRKLFILSVVLLLISLPVMNRSDNRSDNKLDKNYNQRKYSSEQISKNSSDEIISEQEVPEIEISDEEFKAQCNELDYKEVMRNPDNYIGQNMKVTVKVFESCKGGMFSSVDTYYKTFTDNGNGGMGDMIWVMDYRNPEDETYTKILEDDIVTVYGTFNGLGETKNALNGSKSEDMKIDMFYAEISQ